MNISLKKEPNRYKYVTTGFFRGSWSSIKPSSLGRRPRPKVGSTIQIARQVNSGGVGGATPPQCLETAIGIGKSLTSLGICWLDEDTFLGKLAMLGQLTLTGKPNITLPIC